MGAFVSTSGIMFGVEARGFCGEVERCLRAHLRLETIRWWSSSSPREERVGRGPRRGAFRKADLLSPALSSTRWRRGRSPRVALHRRCASLARAHVISRLSFGSSARILASEMETAPSPESTPPRHAWPKFVLLFLLLGVALAILWTTAEVRRAKERRAYIIPDNGTNSAPTRLP